MKKISLFLVAILISTSIQVFATSIPNIANPNKLHKDTLITTQKGYIEKVTELDKLDNSEQIRKTVEVFLALTKAKERDYQNYDCEFLISPDKIKDPKINYRLKTIEYQSVVRNALNQEIVWDDEQFSDYSVTINNNKATAKIVENYTYLSKDAFDQVSNRVREYNFDLEYVNNVWIISSLATNDPWELEPEFEYKDFDVKVEADKLLINSNNTLSPNEINGLYKISAPMAITSYGWTYTRTKAVSYAAKWYNSVNPKFGSASQDCQNFASQCVWAGFGGESKATLTVPPVVYDSVYGSLKSRLWQHNNYYKNATYGSGWYWDNVDGFFALIDSSVSANSTGPYGWVNFGNLDFAETGDVISWDTGGNPGLGKMEHAMVVTKVTGTSGSRGKSNIFIAAHNSPTNSAYQTLTSYSSASYIESYFATARIISGNYSVQQ